MLTIWASLKLYCLEKTQVIVWLTELCFTSIISILSQQQLGIFTKLSEN